MRIYSHTALPSLHWGAKKKNVSDDTLPPLARLHELDPTNLYKLRKQLGLSKRTPVEDVLKAYGREVRKLLKKHLALPPQASDPAIHVAIRAQYNQEDPFETAKTLGEVLPELAHRIMPSYSEIPSSAKPALEQTFPSTTRH